MTRNFQKHEYGELWVTWWLTAALLALTLLFPVLARADQPDDVLAGVDKFAQGSTKSSEVTLDKNMMGLASGMMGGGDPDEKGLAKRMDTVIVRSYEYAEPGRYKIDDVENIRKRLDTGGWSHLVKVHTDKTITDICTRTDVDGGVSQMVIITAEPTKLTFIHLTGHMSPKEMGKVSGSLGGPADPALKPRDK